MSDHQQGKASRRPTRTEVMQSIAVVREFHQQGLEIQGWVEENFAEDSRYGQGIAGKAMVQFGFTNEDDVRKALQFVSHEKGVSEKDINRLAKLAKQERYLLRVTSMKRLLAVPDRTERMQLACRMIRNRWSQEKLQAAIREHNGGPRRSGGRLPRLPESPQQLIQEFQRIAAKWRRYEEAVRSKSRKQWDGLTKKQRAEIREISKAILRHGF